MAVRITHLPIEVLRGPSDQSQARITQVAIEVLRGLSDVSQARATQVTIEVLLALPVFESQAIMSHGPWTRETLIDAQFGTKVVT